MSCRANLNPFTSTQIMPIHTSVVDTTGVNFKVYMLFAKHYYLSILDI